MIKKLLNKLKEKKFFDLLTYFITFYKNTVPSYPKLLSDEDLKSLGNVLILSPHQDDETFGMGGTILKLKNLGNNVNIVRFTNGDNETRKKEAEKLLKKLNIFQENQHTFLNKNTHIIDIDNSTERLIKIINLYKPNTIALPSIFDPHHDHIRLNIILKNTLKYIRRDGNILQYEVWNTLVPNILVDISDVIKEKIELMKLFESQLKEPERKYIERIISLNHYRGLAYMKQYCEGFILTDVEKYLNLFK